MSQRHLVCVCVCAMLFVVLAPQISAGSSDSDTQKGGTFKPKEGLYLSGSWIYNSIGGEFDDSVWYIDGATIYNVPDADSGYGFGITLGGMMDKGAFELSYQRTSHDTHTTLTGVGDQDASFNAIDLNFKVNVFAADRIRPYILLGFGFPWITIENNMVDGSLDDETFTGISLNLGAGVTYFFNPQFFTNAGFMYRWSRFSSVEGESIEKLKASGPSFSVGLGYTF